MSYDIIGDIHGCNKTLTALLNHLNYVPREGVFQHPDRRIIFLGDFIDRGPGQREVIEIVRPMVESGAALSVMGNHEFNAIAYFTPDGESGDYLRKHSEKNTSQHRAFLEAYGSHSQDYAELIDWFRTLPLWLELGKLNIVHACWDRQWIDRITAEQNGSSQLGGELLLNSVKAGNWQFEAIETLLKGKEIPLKDGVSFKDKDGNPRHHIRVRWWDQDATTYKQAFMGPESAKTHIPDDAIEGDHLIDYTHTEPPVFLGHYWMEGEPAPLADNIGCLDYSVAKPGGKLAAYSWDGEKKIEPEKFRWVDRLD